MDTQTITEKRTVRRPTAAERAAFRELTERIWANVRQGPEMTDEEVYRLIAEERRKVREENRARGR